MSNRTIPPFLKKLVQVTDSCPTNIGSWNEDGTQFVVTSSQFADVLRKHFQGSLQTFVRQLHFYSFQKKDDGAKGIWTFSHPNFRRGQPHLLANIERKLNSKKKTTKKDDKSEDSNPDSSTEMILARLVELEEKATRVDILEKEVATLREEMRDYITAQSLSSLDPEKPFNKKRKTLEEVVPKEIVEPSVPPRPSKVTRLTSVDSIMELKDFPFEDTSSLGSVSVKDFMRELQFGIFSDFDEFLPPSNASHGEVPSTPLPDMSDGRGVEEEVVCKKEMDIPQDFVIAQGISRSLLKETFEVMATLCCPRSGKLSHKMFPELRKLCDDHPHPSALPPVELCPIGHELLPTLREHVKEPATDLQLMRAARHTYEIYYQNMMKKLNEANKH